MNAKNNKTAIRLDIALTEKKLTSTRSQAESYIKLGLVLVNGEVITEPAKLVKDDDELVVNTKEQYVSRAGLKLASVAEDLKLNFVNKIVLDVGSSTGGFSDYSLKNGAKKVIAVDVGTNQLHSSLRNIQKIELHEGTDIRNLKLLSEIPDIILVDVSFISLRAIIPSLAKFMNDNTELVAMLKPQFEAETKLKNKGVIKNDKMRRQILNDFQLWLKQNEFIIINSKDSKIKGSKGNLERFYLTKKTTKSISKI